MGRRKGGGEGEKGEGRGRRGEGRAALVSQVKHSLVMSRGLYCPK